MIEQIIRLEPKLPTVHQTRAMTSSFSSRSIDRVASPSMNIPRFPTASTSTMPKFSQATALETNTNPRMMSQPVLPVPVVKRPTQTATLAQVPPPTLSGRISTTSAQGGDSGYFKPIDQQVQYSHPENPSSRTNRDYGKMNTAPTPMSTASSLRTPTDAEKVRVKLQRIRPGTRWAQARIQVIDTLSAFYVENIDRRVQDAFSRLINDLDKHYDNLEKLNRLQYLRDISIGDFGVAKLGQNARWCRARVVTSGENDEIKLLDIDSGNLEDKLIDEFFPLDPKFAQLPAQAIACTLSEACPLGSNEDESLWPQETIDVFRHEVTGKVVEIQFVENDGGTDVWPLHFVRIFVKNQSVTNMLTLKQRIDPKPNSFIAEQLSTTLTQQEFILFNVPIGDDLYEGN